MSVKIALNKYFDKLLEYWEEKYETLPKVPYDEDLNPLLFQGAPDEEEYIVWEPKAKDIYEDFEAIEEKLGLSINNSVKEYFNSYWFLEIEGFYDEKRINLEPVEPEKNIFAYLKNMKQYEENIGNVFKYIQIGFTSPDDLSIAIDNETGDVVIQDYETGEVEILEESLENLINKLRFVK